MVDWAWAQTKLQSRQGCSLVPTESIKGGSESGKTHNYIQEKYFYLGFKSYVYCNKMPYTQKQQLWCDKIISFNSLGFLVWTFIRLFRLRKNLKISSSQWSLRYEQCEFCSWYWNIKTLSLHSNYESEVDFVKSVKEKGNYSWTAISENTAVYLGVSSFFWDAPEMKTQTK